MNRKRFSICLIATVVIICLILFTGILCSFGQSPGWCFKPIKGFSEKTNERLREFFKSTACCQGRKVAVFDGDGTVMGQCPHYLADECLYGEAKKHPEKKPDVISRMVKWSNVSIPYVRHRVYFFEGDSIEYLRDLGDQCFNRYYKNKIFEPMRTLISLLSKNCFEVWIISASPEWMYQKFLSRELSIPVTRIIGVKSVASGGKITSTIVEPVPQDQGKKQAIETFVQERPLLVAGNSRGDREMIEFSSTIRMIINPDEHVEPDQKESIAQYAKKENWLVEYIRDVPEPGCSTISSDAYGVRKNATHEKSSVGQ